MLCSRRAEGGEEGGTAAWAASVQRTQWKPQSSENQASVYSKPWEAPPHQEKDRGLLCLTGQGRVLRIHEQSSVGPTSLGSVVLPSSPSFFSSKSPGRAASSGHLKTHISEVRMDTALFLIGGGGGGEERTRAPGSSAQIPNTHKRPGLLSVKSQAWKKGVTGRQGYFSERAGAAEGAWWRKMIESRCWPCHPQRTAGMKEPSPPWV